MRKITIIIGIWFAFGVVPVSAESGAPITGVQYDSLVASQNLSVQSALEELFPESGGYLVTGPLDPLMSGGKEVKALYHSMRVICPDLASLDSIAQWAKRSDRFKRVKSFIEKPQGGRAIGYRGVLSVFKLDGIAWPIQFNTINQTRWLIWAHANRFDAKEEDKGSHKNYALVVSGYLHAIDEGRVNAREPAPAFFGGLPENLGLFAPKPDYVIEGYQNYKDYLARHAGIETAFAQGILAFVPTDSLLGALSSNPPRAAYPNKEAPMLQHEYRKFFARGGDTRVIETLSRVGFDTLHPGEHFFAVNVAGKVRFGRELLREEVARIEEETGTKVPRANHAFLFPGEPLLTAGAFVINVGSDSSRHIARVNAQSGHYFYSNVSPTIREDIAVHSNKYLLTLGHFFAALERLGIPYESVLVSKL